MHKISDGFIHLTIRWIYLSEMLDVRKDASCTHITIIHVWVHHVQLHSGGQRVLVFHH